MRSRAEREWQPRRAGKARDRLQIAQLDGILHPEWLELLECPADLRGLAGLPQAMQLDHYIHPAADRVAADLPYRPEALIEFCRGDVLAVVRMGHLIERPYLHRADALLEQVSRELAGGVLEAFQVFVRAAGACRPQHASALRLGVRRIPGAWPPSGHT